MAEPLDTLELVLENLSKIRRSKDLVECRMLVEALLPDVRASITRCQESAVVHKASTRTSFDPKWSLKCGASDPPGVWSLRGAYYWKNVTCPACLACQLP